jgi:CHAT domain-containing protein
MDRFYVGLSQKSLSKGEALRQAQISLMQVPQYSHPLFWAPFTLIGNWQ